MLTIRNPPLPSHEGFKSGQSAITTTAAQIFYLTVVTFAYISDFDAVQKAIAYFLNTVFILSLFIR